ncbi:hypothetical protein HYH03_006841 [Edaphochlamys debaryana]|uniref:Uncharacterized protein n=1 Tax=Edaphochlamys debaryana TaxID=47281 RepID=A0A836BZL3_9CHLO|nr:hypothetical protein HYH03_006841 [Edaphochlamys debaryana]|eukprot:KAG2494906.1 hypothetical protein HYH03_006841 [Edaphochlamys debaryana]
MPPRATSSPRPSGVARHLLLAAWLVTASAGHWGRLADAADAAGLLKSCWNEHFNHMPSSFAGWLKGAYPKLYLADVFWSSHDSDLPLTIFTMASMDRLPMLEAQCQGFAGPLAAALYLPLITSGPPQPPPASGPPPAAAHSTQLSTPPAGLQPGAGPPLQPDESPGEGPEAEIERRRLLGARGGSGAAEASSLPATAGLAAAMAWRRRLGEAAVGGRKIGGGGRRVLLEGQGADDALQGLSALHQSVLAAARQELKSFFDRMEAARVASNGTTCSLRVGLFVEVADAQLAAIMPTNALRNAAGLMVQTPLAAMLDVDLGTSASLNRLAADPEWVKSVTAQVSGPAGPGLGILPAFETAYYLDPDTSREVTSVALTESKRVAASLYLARAIVVFQVNRCPHCHGPIRHDEWVYASAPFEVPHNRSFEPWGILSRFEDPGYDERFRGWFHDKIQHVDTLARLRRFRLVVLPDACRPPPHPGPAESALHVRTEDAKQALLKELVAPDGTLASAYRHYRTWVDWLIRTQREVDLGNVTSLLPQASAGGVAEAGPRSAAGPGGGKGGWVQTHRNAQLMNCRGVLPWWRQEQGKA